MPTRPESTPTAPGNRRAVVLFARDPRAEAARKGLPVAVTRLIFDRIIAAAGSVRGADLLLVSDDRQGQDHDPAAARVEGRSDASAGRVGAGRRPYGIVRARGRTLGERVAEVFEQTFARGYERVAIIAGDVPELDPCTIGAAFERLERGAGRSAAPSSPTAVLGPSPDGGFYLLALSHPAPIAWGDVAWYTPRAGAGAISVLARAGYAIQTLASVHDIDGVEGALGLTRRLASGDRAALALRHSILAALGRGSALPAPARALLPLFALSPAEGRAPPAL